MSPARSLTRRKMTLVMLDSLRQFAPRKDENSSNDMAPYISGLSKLAEVTGCAIVLLHHFSEAMLPAAPQATSVTRPTSP